MSFPLNLQRVPLLGNETADETTSEAVNCYGYPWVSIYVIGSDDTISSGIITIETADYNPSNEQTYTGTWSAITTVTAADVTDAQQKAIFLPPGAYAWVRTRISTAIGGGGSISTVLVAVSA